MSNRKILLVGLWLISSTVQAQTVQPTSCLRLAGVVIDYASRKPLSKAQLSAKLSTGYTKSAGNTDEAGSFSISVPCTATTVLIERSGYRPQFLPLNRRTVSANNEVAVCIPLVAIDSLTNNKPYQQSEQKEYIQQTKDADSSGSHIVQHGTFLIKDAIRNGPLQASVCFFFTKNGAKKCTQTNQQGQFDFDFEQVDIVAMEVKAPGYQTYAGNLIIDDLKGRSLRHEVKLQRELTLLAVRFDSATTCELLAGDKTIPLTKVSGHPGWFSSYDLRARRYELIASSEGKTKRQFITISNGLNYRIISEKSEVNTTASTGQFSPELTSKPTESHSLEIDGLSLPDSIPPIYFEQSSYNLRLDSQEVLRRVATYLKRYPNYQLAIEGHTDNVGDKHLNQSLSEYRANVAANFLSRQGITDNRLKKVGYGSQFPISPNDTEENKARNRRVSLKLIQSL